MATSGSSSPEPLMPDVPEAWRLACSASSLLQRGLLPHIPDKGTRTSLLVPAGDAGATHRAATVLRSDVAGVQILSMASTPDADDGLSIDNPAGTSRHTDVATLVTETRDTVGEGLSMAGMSGTPRGRAVMDALDECVAGTRPFVLVINDPVGLSSVDHPDVRDLPVERTWDEEEDLGMHDAPAVSSAAADVAAGIGSAGLGGRADEAEAGPISGDEGIAAAVGILASASRVCVLTGAGISAESGIPPFRSYDDEVEDGTATDGGAASLGAGASASASTSASDSASAAPPVRAAGDAPFWKRYDPNSFAFDKFVASDEARIGCWRHHVELYRRASAAKPNPAHVVWAELQRRGQLHSVITQNIDWLHERGGVEPSRIRNLHGSVGGAPAWCIHCRTKYDAHAAMRRFEESGCMRVPVCDGRDVVGPPVPGGCGGPLKVGTILFGEPLDGAVIAKARADVDVCDALVVMGSSLIVEPANSLPGAALKRGVPVVLINLGETKYDAHCTVRIAAPAGATMARVVAAMPPVGARGLAASVLLDVSAPSDVVHAATVGAAASEGSTAMRLWRAGARVTGPARRGAPRR